MNKKLFTLLFAALFCFSLNSRANDVIVDINAGEINIMGTIRSVPDFEKWYYFSFAQGQIIGSSDFVLTDVNAGGVGTEVPNAEWAARTDWDIAFHSTDIRTNNASALLIADSNSTTPLTEVFANLTEAPKENYLFDEVVAGTFIQSFATMPPLRATQMSICSITNGWATFGMNDAALNAMVVVFQLQDGRAVKVHLKEFFNEEGNPGYIHIEYEIFGNSDNSVVIDVNDGEYPDFSQWYYFSFSEGAVIGTSDFTLIDINAAGIGTEVPSEEWATRTDWDLAFHTTDIRTNKANAVLIADASASTPLSDVYNELSQAPATEYQADEMLTGTFIQSVASMPPPRATQMSGCAVTQNWATFGMTSSEVNPMVVVFELQDGRYVKVYLKDFFNADELPGFISLSYAEIAAPTNSISNDITVEQISIYPNPTSEVLNIKLLKSETITIYNILGKIVKQFNAQEGINTVSVTDLTTGIYLIKTGTQVQKFIIR